MTRLRRADCSAPGLTRRRRGKGFEYRRTDTGERVSDSQVLQRIRELAIPPAWEDVWICPFPNGHLQAVGTDARGRKQYRYHDAWRLRRDAEKFDRMLDFARVLPALRARCGVDLARPDLDRARVLSCATRLLDLGFFRIGTESYAAENDTYGLATMRREHVRADGDAVVFDFPAKGGKRRVQSIVDDEVRAVVTALKRRRTGAKLLAYRDGRRWRDVTSRDINDYVKDVVGEQFSAKDFRTWNATVLAAVAVAVSGAAATSRTARKRAITRAAREVGHYLGNTPTVARNSYIDPRVFDRYLSGWTIAGALTELGGAVDFGEPSFQGPVEEAVIDLLEYNRSADGVAHVTRMV